MTPKTKATRTVPILGGKVIAFRKMRGWSVDELAIKASCSKRTIESVENGKECYPSTLRAIADAFKVDRRMLLADEAAISNGSPATRPRSNRIDITIEVDENFDDFDQTIQLAELVKALMAVSRIKGEVHVGPVYEGSVKIEFEMDESDYRRLLEAYRKGELAPLKIKSISVNPGPAAAQQGRVGDVRTGGLGRMIRDTMSRPRWLTAAAILLVAGVFALAARQWWTGRPLTPAEQVASLEQRAKALQDAPPESAAVRKLRDDLLASPIEVAALAWPDETLAGFMAKTRPRSPAAIEAEFAAQVDGVMAAVAAHPGARRGGASVRLASLPAPQADYAAAVYGRIWQHAGDTGRKLGPKLESFLLEARRPGQDVGMIVPLYCYSMDAAERASWDRVVALAGKSLPVKIVNTRDYSAGFVPTEAYDKAIEHARAQGVEVYAYVNCNGAHTK